MAILSSIPVLNCQSIEETSAFYQQLLQFVVVNKREDDGELHWLHIMNGATALMLQSAGQHNPEPVTNLETKIKIYFYVNKIKDMHHYIKAKCNDISDIRTTDYRMLEFNLTDPEGNIITLGQKA